MKMSDGVILRVASCARLDIHNQSRNAEERCFFPKRLTQVREMLLYTELKKLPSKPTPSLRYMPMEDMESNMLHNVEYHEIAI